MRLVAILLVLLLIAKDTSHLGDRYIMRGIGQGLWLIVGMGWILMNVHRVTWSRYRLLGLYIFVLIVSSITSLYPGPAFIQLASLLSVLIFAVAVASSHSRDKINSAIMMTTFWAYLVVCTISLLLIKVAPGIAYQVGDIAGGTRFAGLFGRPAMMGTASGILIGIALFGKFRRRHMIDVLRVAAGVIGISCLFLSGARTFWIGMIVASSISAYMMYRNKAMIITGIAVCALIAVLVVQITGFTVSKEAKETTFRIESASTLAGRTQIWAATFNALEQSPFFGFGLGMSGNVLVGHAKDSQYFSRDTRRFQFDPTLHSGYVQAFGDSGYLGGILYGLLLLSTCIVYWRHSITHIHGAERFIVFFIAVSNIAETIVFKTSTWQSTLFWYLVVLGFTLRSTVVSQEEQLKLKIKIKQHKKRN